MGAITGMTKKKKRRVIGSMTTSTTMTLMDISDATATVATADMAWIVRKKNGFDDKSDDEDDDEVVAEKKSTKPFHGRNATKRACLVKEMGSTEKP